MNLKRKMYFFYYYYCLINSGSFTYSSVFYFMDIWYLHLCFLILHLYLSFFCANSAGIFIFIFEKSPNICISLGCTKYIQPLLQSYCQGQWAQGKGDLGYVDRSRCPWWPAGLYPLAAVPRRWVMPPAAGLDRREGERLDGNSFFIAKCLVTRYV